MSLILKDPSWSRVYAVDFATFTEIAGGDTIASVNSVVATPTGLTVGAASISGTKVKFNLSSGTLGVTYTITATITTGAGAIVSGVGRLQVLTAVG